MSYANPIDPRIVEIVLDDLEDRNDNTVWHLVSAAYGMDTVIPDDVLAEAREAAMEVIQVYCRRYLR